MAAKYVKRLISVDLSPRWLADVRKNITEEVDLTLHYADIGPVRDLGYPVDEHDRDRWPTYSTSVWAERDADDCDLYLIDGRFRVCCFAELLMRAKNGAVILIHDFENRPQYHAIKSLCRNIAITENLSAFVKDASANLEFAKCIAKDYRFVVE